MAITDVGICNSALIKLGVEPITSLSDNSRQAKLCNEQYSKVRDDLLFEHPWNFAMKRAALTANMTVPTFEFAYSLDLPNDFLRMWATEFPQDFYQIESGSLLSDNSTMNIRYIAKITDASKFSPSFAECLALKLAADLEFALVQSNSLKATLLNELESKLPRAKNFDGQENPSYPLEDDVFINSRF